MFNSTFSSRTLAFAAVLCLSLCSACGPSLRSTLTAPEITGPFKNGDQSGAGAMIYVDQFIDTRPSPAVARLNDRDVAPANEISGLVMEGLEKAMAAKGFRLSDTAPVILAGEIREWVAEIDSGFTSRAEASAALYVEILDPANKRVYSGIYKGFASKSAPGLNERDVQEALRSAMTEAINQVVGDEQLVRLLGSY